MSEQDGGWVLEPKQDEAGLGEYLIVTPPEQGTRYADDGTQAELERLQRENTAQKAIIGTQGDVIRMAAEYYEMVGNHLLEMARVCREWGLK